MSPLQSSGASPLRVAGLTALGIAAGALVLGVISLFSSGSSPEPSDVAQTQTTTAITSTTSEESTSSATTTETSPTTTTDSTTAPSTTPTTTVPPPPAATEVPQPSATPRAPVRVYNNSTIKNLAANAASDLRAAGWQIHEVGNYSSGVISTSTVYYREDTNEEAAARALGRNFGIRVEPRFAGLKNSPAGLIVIVTSDYRGQK